MIMLWREPFVLLFQLQLLALRKRMTLVVLCTIRVVIAFEASCSNIPCKCMLIRKCLCVSLCSRGWIFDALNPSRRQATSSRKRFGLSSSSAFISIQSPINKTFLPISSPFIRIKDGCISTAIVDRLDKVRRARTEGSRPNPREA